MPTSVTGIWANRMAEDGFTLLEVMITLILIGIITSFALLSLRSDSKAERLAVESRRLATLIELNRHEAILLGEQRGVRFTSRGYQFLAVREGGWLPVTGSDLLRQYQLPDDFHLQLDVEGQTVQFDPASPLPQVLLLASGEVTDFSAIFNATDARGYIVTGDLVGNLKVTSVQ